MNELQALLLGIVQGISEPLPISSSGHLILVPWLGDFTFLRENPAFNKTFDVALHFGTLIGFVVYFRRDVMMMIKGLFHITSLRKRHTPESRLTLFMIIGTIPAAIFGATGEQFIDHRLGQPWQIAIFLGVFALLLAWADRLPERHKLEDVTPGIALKIGLAQAAALAPGVSRSGATITAGRWLGLTRESAARFGFFLLIPVTCGALALKGAGVIRDGLPVGVISPMIVGIIAAAVSGYLAIAFLLRFVQRRSYDSFVVYRVLVAIAILLVIGFGIREATF